MIVNYLLRSRETIMEFVVKLLSCAVNVRMDSSDRIVNSQHHVVRLDVSNE